MEPNNQDRIPDQDNNPPVNEQDPTEEIADQTYAVENDTVDNQGIIDGLNAELESTKKAAAEAEAKVSALTSEMDELRNRLNSAEAAKSKVAELETELNSTRSQLADAEAKNSEITTLKEAVEDKDQELSELKSKIEGLEGTKHAQKTELDELHTRVKSLEGELIASKASKDAIKGLQEEVKVLRILASTESRALEMYNVLKGHQSLSLRKLAMQSGMSAQAAKALVEGMERAGLVRIEREGVDDTDPRISLVN
jgi:chromosome segregation ATPase